MIILNKNEVNVISGNGPSWGTVIIAAVGGFIAGGPAGAGFAISGIVAAQGIDNLHDLIRK